MRTSEERAADLVQRGYQEVHDAHGLTVGDRVRLYSEQYRDAYVKGTGNIERIFIRHPSSWEFTYGRQDIELVVMRDRPGVFDNDYSYVADYHVHKSGPANG
jgi:hypothetical protein